MKPSTRLAVKATELRTSINELVAKENLTDEDRTALTEKRNELADTDTKLAAALVAEDGQEQRSDTGEGREVRALTGRASLSRAVHSVLLQRRLEGVEAELCEARGIPADAGMLAWDYFVDPEPGLPVDTPDPHAEQRAHTPAPTTLAREQEAVLDEVYKPTVAGFLNLRTPTVAYGERTYPVLTTGIGPSTFKSPGAEADEPAGALAVKVVTVDKRLTVAYRLRVEDKQAFGPQLDSAMRSSARRGMGDALDNALLGGNGVAPNIAGAFQGIADPAVPSDVIDYAKGQEAMLAMVDGHYAPSLSDIRLLVAMDVYRKVEVMYRSADSDLTLAGWFRQRLGGYRATARLDNAPDSGGRANVSEAYIVLGNRGILVAPMAGGVSVIEDPYTGAGKGETRVVFMALYGGITRLVETETKRIGIKLA